MGKIKNKLKAEQLETTPTQADEGEATTYALLEAEFNYLMNMNVIRMNLQNELSKLMSAYLFNIAVSRLNYTQEDQLKFELDFDNPAEGLKIWKLSENLYKSTDQEPQQVPQTSPPESVADQPEQPVDSQ